jgi:fatty acid desaturase
MPAADPSVHLDDSASESLVPSISDPAIASRHVLTAAELSGLNPRSTPKGIGQLLGHLAVMGLSGYLWATQTHHLAIALPALVIYGFSLAAMFAPMHECAHRTAFADNWLNDMVAWWAGVLSFYNSTFYRLYHKWHHRYTQIPEKDPELSDRKPRTPAEYWIEISGGPWWIGKLQGHGRIALGNLDGCPYVPEAARAEVIQSIRLQLLVYAGAIALSLAVYPPAFMLYWMLPLAIGQPMLRAIMLAEHTDCTQDENPFTNTRTTLTWAPLRWLMWNMPFHAEHHLYTAIPFHALPAAHERLRSHFAHVDLGYLRVNRTIMANLSGAQDPATL